MSDKIIIISPFAPPEVGANAERVSHFQSYFSKQGIPTEIWSPDRGNASVKGVRRYSSIRSLYSRIRNERPRLIIGTSPPMTHSAVGAIGAFFSNIPFVLDIRDPWPDAAQKIGLYSRWSPKYWIYKFLEHLTLFLASQVWVVNSYLQGQFSGIVAKKKVHVVANGTLPTRFKPSAVLRKKMRTHYHIPIISHVILFSGDFSSHGLESFLTHTIPCLKKKDAWVVLATSFSTPKTIPYWKSFFESHGYSNYTLIDLPAVPYADVAGIFAMADWGVSLVPPVLPYMIPVKTYDYMASGLFVVARGPKGGALDTFLQTYDAGLFFASDEEAAKGMNEAFRFPKWKNASANAKTFSSLFNRDIQAQKAMKLIHSILKKEN